MMSDGIMVTARDVVAVLQTLARDPEDRLIIREQPNGLFAHIDGHEGRGCVPLDDRARQAYRAYRTKPGDGPGAA